MDSADASDTHNTNDAGDLTCFASGCVLTLALDCTHAAGQADPTGAAALRVAVWERQKALKDDTVGSVIGPDIQLSTLLVSKAVWPDVQSLLDEEDSPLQERLRMMVEGALNVEGKENVHAPVAEFAFPQGEMGVPRYGFDVERAVAYGDAKWSVMMTSEPNEQNSSPARLCTTALITALAAELHMRFPDRYGPGSTLRPKTDDVDNLLFAYETLAVDEDGMESKRVVRGEPLFMRPARMWIDALGQEFDSGKGHTRACAPIIRARDINPYLLSFLPDDPVALAQPKGAFVLEHLEPLRLEATSVMRPLDGRWPFPPVVSFTCPQLLAALRVGAQSLGPKL